MSCVELRRYLSAYLDSELDARTSLEVSDHLERCDDCAARVEGEVRLERAMRDRLNATPVREEFWNGVDAALAAGTAPSAPAPAAEPRGAGRWWWPVAAAASLAAVVGGAWALGPGGTPGAAPDAQLLVDVLAERSEEMKRHGTGALHRYSTVSDEAQAIERLTEFLGKAGERHLRLLPRPDYVQAHQLALIGTGLSHVGDREVPVLHYRCCGKNLCVFFIVPAAMTQFPSEAQLLAVGQALLGKAEGVSVRRCTRSGGVVGVVGSGCSDGLAVALVSR